MTMTINLPIIPLSTPEHELARRWRLNIMRLSAVDLAKLTHYSVSSIVDFERGHYRGVDKPIEPDVMARYRLVCAAVAAGLDFDWRTCKATIHRSEIIDLIPAPRSPAS